MEEKKLTGYPSIDKPWLKYYSEEAIHAKLPENTIYGYMYDCNKDFSGDIALEYFGKKTTYGQLFLQIEAAAKAFWELGVRSGDIVALCTVTTPETIYAFYGLNRLGAIANMIDPRTHADGIKQYLNESEARVMVMIDVAYPKIDKLISDTGVEKVIVVSAANAMPLPVRLGYRLTQTTQKIPFEKRYISWEAFMAAGRNAQATYAAYSKNTPAVIIHTGGTTGIPKGVILSNDNLNTMVVLQKHSRTRMQRGNKFLDIMPPFITYGLVCGISNPLCLGLQVIIIPKFDPAKFASLVVKYKPNHALGVPSFWEDFAKSPNVRDLSFIENAITGGDRIAPAAEAAINAFFGEHGCRYRLSKGYGMTELSSAATYSVCDECNLPESVGVPLFLNNVKIVEPGTQNELTYDQIGEVCLTSPTMMLGYYHNEEETRRTLAIHDDGLVWIHSGDIGYMNEDGVLFIVDRMKRMIARSDGFKAYPSMIESVIMRSKAVSACAVIGVREKECGQGLVPKAFIVPKKDETEQPEALQAEIMALCEKQLAEYALPIEYILIDTLPLTPIGKVDYRALEREGTDRQS